MINIEKLDWRKVAGWTAFTIGMIVNPISAVYAVVGISILRAVDSSTARAIDDAVNADLDIVDHLIG